jgi:glutamyl-tRNA reductase
VNGILVVGWSHKTAPVELRERCGSLPARACLEELRARAAEVVVVSTCNRFEVYASEAVSPSTLVDWIAEKAAIPHEEALRHLYVRHGRNAAKHLFLVCSSLDSLVVGETQIRGQVKDGYALAQEAGTAGAALNRLFQAALRVSKEISESTGVGRGNVSVAGAAADLAERVFGDLASARVLVIGAGETAELVLQHLAGSGVRSFTVLNRTLEKAQRLAERHGGQAGGLEGAEGRLEEADLVVAAASGEERLLAAPVVRSAVRRRRGRPMVLIDIALPRAVDPAVDGLDNVYRYDMDALQAITEEALRHRRKDFLQCCTLVDGAALRLEAEARSHAAGPAIAALEEEYRLLGERELEDLERRLPGLGEPEKQQVRRTIHRLVRKFLHMPVRALRDGEGADPAAVRRVFSLPPGRDT